MAVPPLNPILLAPMMAYRAKHGAPPRPPANDPRPRRAVVWWPLLLGVALILPPTAGLLCFGLGLR